MLEIEVVIPLRDMEVSKGDALPPESASDVKDTVVDKVVAGAIAGVDGGRALESAVRKAASGSVPRSTAVHSRKPRKQFTALHKIPVDSMSPALKRAMQSMGRLSPSSGSVKSIGGNQKAESAWGTGKMHQKSRCVHRGGAHLHATAHATAALFMTKHPRLKAAGQAFARFIRAHMDRCAPRDMFSPTGWTGAGARKGDDHGVMVAGIGLTPLTTMKRPATSVVEKEPVQAMKRPAANVPQPLQAMKRPAAGVMQDDQDEQTRRSSLGLVRPDCPLCTAKFQCAAHS